MDQIAQTLDRAEATLNVAKRAIISGAFAEAAKTVQALAEQTPDSLYIGAIAERRLGRFEAAQSYLDRLFDIAPTLGRGWQERGNLARDRGQAGLAFVAYYRACRTNPALVGAWIGLATVAEALGRVSDAKAATAEVLWLQSLPTDLVKVAELIHDGHPDKAERLCRRFLAENPDHPEALRLLAELAKKAGALEDARTLLDAALAVDPANHRARIDDIQLLCAVQDLAAAHRAAERLYADRPDDPMVRVQLAIQKINIGAFDESLALFDQAIAAQPDNADAHVSRAHVLKTIGRRDEAIAGFRRAIAMNPAHGDAYYALANMKTFRFDDDDIAAMEHVLGHRRLLPGDLASFHFALGVGKEARGEYRAAFDHFSAGNALKLAGSRYDPDAMQAEIARQKIVFDGAVMKAHGGAGCPAADPIFVVGLPRAGSTLIEQILSSHPAIDGTMELHLIPALADRHARQCRARGRDPNDPVEAFHADELRAMGEAYLAGAAVHRRGAPYFIDKMPNNFRHVGLIRLILPNARIIDARRDAMDCCWSCFKQLFAKGQEFTYGQAAIGRYYRDYLGLMDHWNAVLGEDAILRVQHEELIEDTEGQVRRILDYLGLPFDRGCLDFHRNGRPVSTASSEQVRRPINRDGVGRWQPYAAWLGPMREALGHAAAPGR